MKEAICDPAFIYMFPHSFNVLQTCGHERIECDNIRPLLIVYCALQHYMTREIMNETAIPTLTTFFFKTLCGRRRSKRLRIDHVGLFRFHQNLGCRSLDSDPRHRVH